MGRVHEFAGDETRYEPMFLVIRGIVVDEQVIGMLASFPKAVHGLLVRLWN
jgi:hypothetical protein